MKRTTRSGEAAEHRPRGYRGVRRRRWGKWVSEIRVPGTRERLWLGSYATPEAAAVAHDTAVYFLRGGGGIAALNFPERAAATGPGACPRGPCSAGRPTPAWPRTRSSWRRGTAPRGQRLGMCMALPLAMPTTAQARHGRMVSTPLSPARVPPVGRISLQGGFHVMIYKLSM
jgi:hypothetical protein